jgi:AraC family transcriptional regulator
VSALFGLEPLAEGCACPAQEASPGHLPAAPRFAMLDRAVLGRLAVFVEDNLHGSIALSDLAAVANVSKFHFCRLFKQRTGMTPMAFVEQLRIERARQLIRDTTLALAEVALLTGFADQSHFTRRFRRRVGVTPAVFARQCGAHRQPRRHERSSKA